MKAVFLNSGGIDSLAVVKMLSKEHDLFSLYINLGQENTELAALSAYRLSVEYKIEHRIISLDFPLFSEKGQRYPGIPFQAAIIHSLGASYARGLGIDYLVSGFKNDSADERFENAFLELIKTSKITDPVILIRPVAHMDFQTIYEIVKDDPFLKKTVSCNRNPSCGECYKCKMRKQFSIDV